MQTYCIFFRRTSHAHQFLIWVMKRNNSLLSLLNFKGTNKKIHISLYFEINLSSLKYYYNIHIAEKYILGVLGMDLIAMRVPVTSFHMYSIITIPEMIFINLERLPFPLLAMLMMPFIANSENIY